MPEKPLKILVVEDNPEDFQILKVLFSKIKHSQYTLENVGSLSAAIGKLKKREHDAYLVDYQLGPDSGMEFLKEAGAVKCDVPIILLTGLGDHETDLKAMALGASDFLNKNKLDPDILERSIRYAMERKKAEESRSRLAAIVETSNDAIFTLTMEGTILSWNPGAQRIYGFSPEEILGKSINLIVPPGRQDEIPKMFEVIREGSALPSFETQHYNKKGQVVLVSVTLSPLWEPSGKVSRASIIARDVTESYKAREEKDILQAERDELLTRLQIQMESMPIACVVSDRDFNFTYWNPAAEKIFGFSFKDVEGKHAKDTIVPRSEWSTIDALYKKLAAGDRTLVGLVNENVRKDGKLITCEWYNTPLFETDGKFFGRFSVAIDVTERLKAEKIRAQLAAVLEQTSDAVFSYDIVGLVSSWNRGAELLLGYQAEEIIGKPMFPLVPTNRMEESERLREMALGGQDVSNFETVLLKKNKTPVDVTATLSPIRNAEGRIVGISAIFRDISVEKNARESLKLHEEQMRLTQKMDAIGRLAGGVAHDFNNLLSVIGGNGDFLMGSLAPEDPHREEISEIKKAVERGAELTKQLLVFGKKQVSQPQSVNLRELSLEMSKMLKRLIDASIDFKIIQDEKLHLIYADPGQIQQVILNLVLNSRDAMPQGGNLIVETKNVEAEEVLAGKGPVIPPGDYVRLSVTDTGIGMDEETQKHVFEPFFTTKAGKGTGLGLATVYGIVQQWKGILWLHSTPGLGTTFSIYFPAVKEAPRQEAKPKQIAMPIMGSGTILVAEDEDPVRKIVVRTLEKQGYKILQAANGIEAVKIAWEYPDPILLLLTDTVMPKMNGKELADELKKARPKIKVLFMSGYPREVLSQQGVIDPSIHLIQKPFSNDELVDRIRKVLEER